MSLRDVKVSPEVPKLEMTPMIDIVFNLLAFFIITFRIPAVEGDFNIKMPVNAPPSSESMDETAPLEITLRSCSRIRSPISFCPGLKCSSTRRKKVAVVPLKGLVFCPFRPVAYSVP